MTSTNSAWRAQLRGQALQNAMAKREAGVPTYSVPEAAALLSISQEYLYRLIQADGFPAVRMRLYGSQGRYVVPAKAVERLLGDAIASGSSVDATEWTANWSNGGSGSSGGAA
jgi:excisionase family DNA binding protein